MSMQPPEDNPESQASPLSGTPSRPLGRSGNTVPNSNWGRRTGGLGRGVPAEPPDLRRYPPTPRYDMATIADLVGVRAVTLWSWEQNLGIIVHDPAAEAATGLRYSERDLIILIWLREQIVAGADPLAAAQRIREAITAAGGTPPPMPSTPRTPSRPLGSITSRLAEQNGNMPGPTGARYMDPTLNPPSQPISRIGASRPMSEPLSSSQPKYGPSRPVSAEGGQVISQTWTGMLPKRDLSTFIQPLLHGFSLLNTAAVMQILDEALMTRSVETTCATLITPALARVSELWIHNDVIQPEALFAINVFKSRLFRLFDVLHEHRDAPLTFVASGPSDLHELDALMLALFWRRAGLRVVYFGQNIDGVSLVERVHRHHPRVVALTIAAPTRTRMINRFVRDVARLEAPRASVGFVGSFLARHPEMQRKFGGIFLGVDPNQATHQVRQLLHLREAHG